MTVASSDNGSISRKINENRKKDHVGGNGNNPICPIYPLLSTWITTCTEPEALYE
jgi:hypothetical protein